MNLRYFLCLQMDVGNNVTSFFRNVLSFDVQRIDNLRLVMDYCKFILIN